MLLNIWRWAWPIVRANLPYPDLPRRIWVRRKVRRLVDVKRWPGDDAKGADAARLALLRLLWLQRLIRRAVRAGRSEEAAFFARAALETSILGLYCLHSDAAVTGLTAANNRKAQRVVAYLIQGGLVSEAAVKGAAQALGEDGPDLNLKDLALWLKSEKGIDAAPGLYDAYYVPLSHFFTHANAFTLMRHVGPDGKLHRRPVYPWARRSAARLGDGCVGWMAGAIAERSGLPSARLTRYAERHLDRMLTPAVVMALKGAWRAGWRKVPTMLRSMYAMHRYTRGGGRGDDPAKQDARIREGFMAFFGLVIPDAPDGMFDLPIDEFVSKVVAGMNAPAGEAPKEAPS